MPAIDEMSGSKIDVLIRDYGLPDMIEPASKFNAKFVGMESASVVLTYIALGRHVYVRKDCTIIIVIKISK